jgi:CRISPR/Cas system CMR-associated protein Cmr5 small subunit
MSPLKLKKIYSKIEDFLKILEKEEDVKITLESVRGNTGLVYRTILSIKEDNESVKSIYDSFCKKIGFTQNVMGMKFNGKNGVYEIVDIKPRNRLYPVIAKSETGETFKYSVSHIKKLIGGDKIINRNANLDKLIND